MKKIAVVYFADDGFVRSHADASIVAHDFLQSFPEVARLFGNRFEDISLSLIEQDVRVANGEGDSTKPDWDTASADAAAFLYSLRDDYDTVLAICVDAPFAHVAAHFAGAYKEASFRATYRFIWLPQSTARLATLPAPTDQAQAYASQRYAYEKSAVDLAKTDSTIRIGCIGEYMRGHLLSEYDAAPETLVALENSLYLPRLELNRKSQPEIAAILEDIGAPTDRKLLFSFGNAEPGKGLDVVLKNCSELIEKHGFFVLIYVLPQAMDAAYADVLRELAAAQPEDVKVIFGQDHMLPHYIMQWQYTEILALLPQVEPFGIAPIEARYYNNPDVTVVVGDQGGLAPQIKDGKDGFITPVTGEAISATLARVAVLTGGQKQEIAKSGYDKVLREYNQITTNIAFLEQYVRI